MKTRFVSGIFFLLAFGLPAQAGAHPAGQVVKSTADNVLERLRADQDNLNENPDQIYDLVQELIVPHFDMPSISRWVLGRSWRDASTEQRQQFTKEFQTLLIRTYAKALLEYSDQEIQYQPVREDPESNMVIVRTEVKQSGSQSVPINYRMHMSDGEWKVIDVAVNGVSLVSTYRNSFASEVRRAGLDTLIERLAERNARGQHEIPKDIAQ